MRVYSFCFDVFFLLMQPWVYARAEMEFILKFKFLKRGLCFAAMAVIVVLQSPEALAGKVDRIFSQRVPAGSLAYLGWAGQADGQGGYEGSHLQQVVDASNIKEVLSLTFARVLNRIALEKREFAMIKPMVQIYSKMIASHQWAVILTDVKQTGRQAMPQGAILLRGGDELLSLKTMIEAGILAAPKEVQPLLHVEIHQGVLIVTLGEFNKKTMAIFRGQKLAGQNLNPKGLVDHPQVALHYNIAKFMQILAANRRSHTRRYREGLELLAMDKFKSITLSMGFQGKDWVSRGFLAIAREKNIGLWTLFNRPFQGRNLLSSVPASAEIAGGFSLDVVGLEKFLSQFLADNNPRAKRRYDQIRARIDQELGINLQKDILENLGQDIVYYTDKNVNGTSILGLVGILKVKDPARFQASLLKALAVIQKQVNHKFRRDQITASIKQTTYDGIKVYYLATPALSPAWSIYQGRVYVGLYPQTVAGAIHHVKTKGKNILSNAQFVGRLFTGKRMLQSFHWFDIPAAAQQNYTSSVFLSRTLMGAGDLLGVDTPAFVVPPFYKVRKHLIPSTCAIALHPDGFGFSSREGFIGSHLFAKNIVSIIAPAISSVGFGMVRNSPDSHLMDRKYPSHRDKADAKDATVTNGH